MAVEECPIDCSTKKTLDIMQPQLSEVHEYIIQERAAKKALEQADEKRRKNITLGIGVITVVLLLLGAIGGAVGKYFK